MDWKEELAKDYKRRLWLYENQMDNIVHLRERLLEVANNISHYEESFWDEMAKISIDMRERQEGTEFSAYAAEKCLRSAVAALHVEMWNLSQYVERLQSKIKEITEQ